MADNSVTVAVRVRPMNKREIGLGTKCCIDMVGNQTVLQSTSQVRHTKVDSQSRLSSNSALLYIYVDQSF